MRSSVQLSPLPIGTPWVSSVSVGEGVEDTCLWRPVLNLGCLYQSLPTFFFDRGSLIGRGHLSQSGLAGPQNLRYPPTSTSPALELQAHTITPAFMKHGFWQ